ncbi:hypothetical protein V495_07512 [Pseudogymnoascus sp. VKM F-4514 (FW-929)]|nr:hypothetical protein V495_07512 [Pseudogymnoascus sp. VKM F-4514 (FW-929)]KFY58176.1 hypothetical protein V497_05001 [Pseudogymnoascus sp. VKM F-4516 (FW-969)]
MEFVSRGELSRAGQQEQSSKCSRLAGIQKDKENSEGLLTDIEVRGMGRDRASGGAPEYPSERRVPLFEAWKGRCRSSRVA